MSNRIFSEEAIQKIIKRAAELQKQESVSQKSSEHGLTMDELLKIGAEAGLDTTHLQMAAEEISDKAIATSTSQNDTHIFEERLIETPANIDFIFDEIKAEMRQNFNDNAMFGNYKEYPRERELVYNSMSGIVTTARVSRQHNGIKIRMSQRVGLASSLTEGLLYGGIITVLVSGVLFAAFETTLAESIAMFSSLMVLFSIITYALDVAWRKKKHRQLSLMLDKIVAQIPEGNLPVSTPKKEKSSASDISAISIEEENVYLSIKKGESLSDSPLKQNLKE